MMTWLHRFFLHFRFYRRLANWTKTIKPPGFHPMSLYQAIGFFVREIEASLMVNRASSLAYSFMLAFFPAAIFLITLIPFIPIANFQTQLLNIIATILPYNAYMAFENTILDIIKRPHPSLASFGFLTALYFATSGIHKLMQDFNRSSLKVEKRSWLKRRVIALVLTIGISFSLLIAIAIMIAGQTVIGFMQSHTTGHSHFWLYVLKFSRWIIVVAIFFVSISLLYRYGPANKEKWKFLNTGSVLATGLAILTSIGFGYYINNFSSYNKLYGSIGTLIVLMIWLYLNSFIVLIGFELNASLDFARRNIKVAKPRFNHFRGKVIE
jgi:membrane protein